MPTDAEEHVRDAACGSGTVFLVANDPGALALPNEVGDFVIEGYWDHTDESNEARYLEGSPRFTSVEHALGWALARTPRVLLRSDTPAVGRSQAKYFWAGEGPPPDGMEVW